MNEIEEYGQKLEALGKLFQNPDTNLSAIVAAGVELGLIVRVWLEPDPNKSITLTEETP